MRPPGTRAQARLHALASQLRVSSPADGCGRSTGAGESSATQTIRRTLLRVGVAGCHRQTSRPLAGHNFSSALAVNPDVEIAGVFDHGAETRAAYIDCWGSTVQPHATLAALLTTRLDILVIAARQTMHADMVEAAVAAGVRGLLVDKPLCTSLAEADRITSVCECAGVPLLFALDRRWASRWEAVRAAVDSGVVGAVQAVSVYGVSNTVNHGCHYTGEKCAAPAKT